MQYRMLNEVGNALAVQALVLAGFVAWKESIKRITTPTTMHESATLNAGQWYLFRQCTSKKSMT